MQIAQARAIVTGGASGLGEAAARHFRASGAEVVILDRDQERAERVARSIGAGFVETDVTSETSAQNAIDQALSRMGGIDVCLNCAGIVHAIKTVGRNGAHPYELFTRTIDINLAGSFNIARLAAAAMRDNAPSSPEGERGVIINTASIAAYDGQKGQAAYAASKGGIAAMTLPMARDLAVDGIRVMAIAPGLFMTPMLAALPEAARAQLASDIPYPARLGAPEEFARLAGFIVEMSYLNGEVIRLDGALRMR